MKRAFPILVAFALALISTPATSGCKEPEDCTCNEPVHDCLNTMVTKLKTTGFIGVEIDEDKATKALTVSEVIPGSPAEAAGIVPGDVLYALNGIRFDSEHHDEMAKVKVPGNEVTCTIKRNGASKQIKLTLVPMPADLMAKYIGEHMMVHAAKDEPKRAKN